MEEHEQEGEEQSFCCCIKGSKGGIHRVTGRYGEPMAVPSAVVAVLPMQCMSPDLTRTAHAAAEQ